MLQLFSAKGRFDSLFNPKSIAVIGASTEKEKIGGYIFSQVLKLKSVKAYPINVKWERVQGVKAYKRVNDIGKKIDLVIISIPGAFVIDAMKDVITAGVKNVVIISAGFKEVGEEGKKREDELRELIQKHDLNVVGPNCLGISNPQTGLNCSFAKDLPDKGGIALISQSGAVIDALIDWSFKHHIGFSKIVSLGNMAGIDALAMLKYLKDDPKTTSIVFYMETLERGSQFAKVLRETTKVKPVIIIKPGNSANAQKAIGSHTGSLTQDNELVKLLIEENNGILVDNLNELYSMMIGLSMKLPKNKELVIITNAGGPGVIATDMADTTEFDLYTMTSHDKSALSFLPKEASLNNPIDMLGDAKSDRYFQTLEYVAHHPHIGAVLVLLTPQIMTDTTQIAKDLVSIAYKSDMCFASAFLGNKEIAKGLEYFDSLSFPNFESPHDALFAMNKLYKYNHFNYSEKRTKYVFDDHAINRVKSELEGKSGLLDYDLTKKVLGVLELHMPKKWIVSKREDIQHIHLDSHKKYVLKGDGKDFVHKKDVGGVVLNVSTVNLSHELNILFSKLEKVSKEFSITIEEQVQGHEIIVGLKHDENLGNFIMFGMGGTYVSIFKDVHFALAPLTPKRAEELVNQSKVSTLLDGYRGSEKVDKKVLYEVLMRMSYLHEIFPEIKEVDLNPIICNSKGIYFVDVKLLL